MHITLRGLRVVDVGIIYPILGKVLFQISFTNYENILPHNTSLVTSGNSGLPRLNSSRKSSDIPLPTQLPIWVNPMGPITLTFGKKCYSVTTPGDNLHKTCFHWMHVLTTQAQVTASGIFPWSDWLPTGIPVNEIHSQQSARAACTQCSAWRCCVALFDVNKPAPVAAVQ